MKITKFNFKIKYQLLYTAIPGGGELFWGLNAIMYLEVRGCRKCSVMLATTAIIPGVTTKYLQTDQSGQYPIGKLHRHYQTWFSSFDQNVLRK